MLYEENVAKNSAALRVQIDNTAREFLGPVIRKLNDWFDESSDNITNLLNPKPPYCQYDGFAYVLALCIIIFGKVKHEVITMLENLNVDGKDLIILILQKYLPETSTSN